MKKRYQLAGLLVLLLALACVRPQAAEVPDTPAPTESPAETPVIDTIATPGSDTVEWAKPTPEPTPEPTPTPEPMPEPSPTPAPLPLAGIKIGLDPGHQQRPNYNTEPNAPGEETQKAKCSSGTRGVVTLVYEYEVNLQVALKLKALLEEGGAEVFITRVSNNVNLSNIDRAEYFNANEVDLAIRLHCNGTDDPTVRGAFMLVPEKNRTAYYNENVRMATLILEQYCKATGLSARKRNGIAYSSSQTGFNWCTRPIICIEMGHLSNETEDLLLTNDAFQDKMADGIYRGILACFDPDSASEGGTP